MKVLFVSSPPFFLAHGGSQTLLEALMREIASLGVEVEPARWWDDKQTGDILHFMNLPPGLNYLRLAKEKRFKLLMTHNLDQTSSRSDIRLAFQRLAINAMKALIPGSSARMGWACFQELDAMVYVVDHEWEVAKYLFDAPADRGYIIPHGLEEGALASLALPAPEEDYLISVAVISPRKNTVLLAEAAQKAKVPIVFLGKPFSEDSSYFLKFKSLVDGKYVRYPGFVSSEEKHRLLRGARGFALLSEFESGCIAVYEAGAAGLPLFLAKLPWATKVYGNTHLSQFAKIESADRIAPKLASFYQEAHRQPGMTFPIGSWKDIARQYVAIYEKLLSDKGSLKSL